MDFVLKSQVELRLRQQKIGSFVKKEMCSVVDLGFIFFKTPLSKALVKHPDLRFIVTRICRL